MLIKCYVTVIGFFSFFFALPTKCNADVIITLELTLT